MILEALVHYYEVLLKQGKADPPGWDQAKISLIAKINENGDLVGMSSAKVEVETKPGKTAMVPMLMTLPAAVKRGNNPLPNFLWDNSTYVFGMDEKGKPDRSMTCFSLMKKLHLTLLDKVSSPEANALKMFFRRWDPEKAREDPVLQPFWNDLMSGANIVFVYEPNGSFIHEDQAVRDAWQAYYSQDGSGPDMVCLVTGKKGPVEAIHPAIKGIAGAQPTGASLVSFNAPAFCSYGQAQNYNAPVSKYAAFAYTYVLNYMLRNRDQVYRMGNTTVLFWSSDGDLAYAAMLRELINGGGDNNHYTSEELAEKAKALMRGKLVSYDDSMVDPDMDFYLLGIDPNAGRLSIRFFLHNTFGSFVNHVWEHYGQLEIEKSEYDKQETIPMWQLLATTVNDKAKAMVAPDMAGALMQSILTGAPYPAAMVNGVQLRISAEHKVNRVRAAILKAYYLRTPNPQIPEEVLTVSLNPDCREPAYILGRLFSVLENIQDVAIPNINASIRDKYFNSASAMPASTFPTLINLAQKHLKKLQKLQPAFGIYLDRQMTALLEMLDTSLPEHLTPPQQASFQLGYYHQNTVRYTKKEEN